MFAHLRFKCLVVKMLSKKAINPAIKHGFVNYLTAQFGVGHEERTQPDVRRDTQVIQVLVEVAEHYSRNGYKRLFAVQVWNNKCVHRIYCLLKLDFIQKGKQRLVASKPVPLITHESMNLSWSIDFTPNTVISGLQRSG